MLLMFAAVTKDENEAPGVCSFALFISKLPLLLTIIRQLMFYWCRWVVQLRALVTVMSTPGPVSVGAAACRHGGVDYQVVKH